MADQTQIIRIVVDASQAERGTRTVKRGLEEVGQAARVSTHQLQQLTPQLNDLFIQIAGGQGLFLPLIQQGPQITQIFGGLANTLRLIPGPLLAVAAAAGAVAAGFAAWNKHTESIRAVDAAVRLMGNSLGTTRDAMEAMAVSAAQAGNVSIQAARSMQVEYVKSGKIGSEAMASLIALTKDYAAATGKDLGDATKELASAMKEPGKAAQDLSGQFNLLSDSQIQFIKRLDETGKKAQAQAVLTQALANRVKDASEQTSIWARAWDGVTTAASNAADAVGKAIDKAVNGPSLDERIAKTKEYVNQLRAAAEEEQALGSADKSWQPGQSIGDPTPAPAQSMTPQLQQATQALDDLLEKQRELNRGNAFAKMTADARAASVAAGELTRSLDQTAGISRNLDQTIATLGRALSDSLAAGMLESAARTQEFLDAAKRAKAFVDEAASKGISPELLKQQKLNEINSRAAGMGPQARERYVAEESAKISGIDNPSVTNTQLSQSGAAARQQVLIAQKTAAADAARELTLAAQAQERLAEAAGKGEAAQRRASIENQVAAAAAKGLGDATRKSLEAQEAFQQVIIRREAVQGLEDQVKYQTALAQAYAQSPKAVQQVELAEKARTLALKEATAGTEKYNEAYGVYLDLLTKGAGAAEKAKKTDYAQTQDQNLAVAQKELELAGETDEVRERIIGRMQLEYDLKKQFPSISQDELNVLLEKNDTLVQTNQLVQKQKDAWKTITDALDKAFDRLGDALVQVFIEGKGEAVKFSDVIKSMIVSIAADLAKLALVNPLKNAILGQNNPTLFSLLGGAAGAMSSTGSGSGSGQGQGQQGGGILGLASSGSSLGNLFSGSQSLYNIGSWLATSQVGQALGLSSTMTTANLANAGVMGVQGGLQAGTVSMTGLGSTFAQGLSYSPWGIVGSLGAGLLGIGKNADPTAKMILSTGGSIAGGMAGAAAGSAIGGTMAGMSMGSVLGPVGAIAGAVLGTALSGLFKKDVDIPWAQAGLSGGQRNGSLDGVLDKGPADDIKKLADAAQQSLTSIAAIAGIDARTTGDGGISFGRQGRGLYTWTERGGIEAANQHQFGENAEGAVQDLVRRLLQSGDLSKVDPNVKLALTNSKATKVEDLAQDVSFARSFKDTIQALKGGSLDFAETVGGQARTEIENATNAVKAFKAKTAELYPPIEQFAQGVQQVTKTRTVWQASSESIDQLVRSGKVLAQSFGGGGEAAETFTQYIDAATGQIVQFNQAGQAMISVQETYTEAVQNSTKVGEVASQQMKDAAEATQKYVINLLGLGDTTTESVTEVQATVQALAAKFTQIGPLLAEVGLSADLATQGLNKAMATLKDQVTAGLTSQINEAEGKGYLNVLGQINDAYRNNLRDLQAVGGDAGLALRLATAQIKSALSGVDASELATIAQTTTSDLVRSVVQGMIAGLQAAGSGVGGLTDRGQDIFNDVMVRMLQASGDTLAAQVYAFDQQAQAQRLEAGREGFSQNQMVLLEKTLAAERAKIVEDYYRQIRDQELAGQQQQLQTQMQETQSRQAEVQRLHDTFAQIADQIHSFRTSLVASDLNPGGLKQRLDASATNFDTVIQKALAGDQDALAEVASSSDEYLRLAKEYYGDQSQYVAIWQRVQSATQSAETYASTQVGQLAQQLSLLANQLSVQQQQLDQLTQMRAELARQAAQSAVTQTETVSPINRDQAYLNRYPDVAAAVRAGWLKNGLEHFLAAGQYEGRTYAKGGAFTNGIVDEPTPFPLGMMGEAGPEAIMPLTRMSSGHLGVRAANQNGVSDALIQQLITEVQALRDSGSRDNEALAMALIQALERLGVKLSDLRGELMPLVRKRA